MSDQVDFRGQSAPPPRLIPVTDATRPQPATVTIGAAHYLGLCRRVAEQNAQIIDLALEVQRLRATSNQQTRLIEVLRPGREGE